MSSINRTINVVTQVYGSSDDVPLDIYVNGELYKSVVIGAGQPDPMMSGVRLYNFNFTLDLDTTQDTTITFGTKDTSHHVSLSMSAGVNNSINDVTDMVATTPFPSLNMVIPDTIGDNQGVDGNTKLSYVITPDYLAGTTNGLYDSSAGGYVDLTGSVKDDVIVVGGTNLSIGYHGQNGWMLEGIAHGDAGNDLMYAGTSSGTDMNFSNSSPAYYALYGDAGNDTLVGNIQGYGVLDGGDGNDIIYEGYAAETLIGGAGKNTFVLGRFDLPNTSYTGFGELPAHEGKNINTISYSTYAADMRVYDSSVTRADTIDMNAFISASFSRDGDDLIIRGASQLNAGEGSTQISTYRVEYYFSDYHPVGKLSFGGQDLRVQDVTQLISLYGDGMTMTTRFNDSLNLKDIEMFNGLVIKDAIHLRQGDDTVICGSGENTIYADQGNDTIVNAKVAYGGTGNDTYIYNFDDTTFSQATIAEASGVNDLGDVLSITVQNSHQLWFSKSEKDLVVSVIGTDNSVTVKNWYASQQAHVETIQAGGQTITDRDVAKLVQAMSGLTPPAAGQTTMPAPLENQLAAVYAATWK